MSPAFLPLYFDDEDYEIWMRLIQVEPEHRSLYIKEILRKALVDNAGETKEFDSRLREVNPVETSQVKSITGESTPPESIPKESSAEIPLVDFSLEDLFIVSPDPQEQLIAERPDPDRDSVSVRPLDRANTSGQMKGLNHLLNQVIGEENDEDVLRFFARRKEGN